jgi:glycerophosphoryl diester phosphodiesterase
MHRLLDWGVDGLLSDFPDRLARVLHERVQRPLPPALRA